MASVFQGRKTKAEAREQERKERQDELGVCRIRSSEGDHRSQTLGCGFVVKDLQIDAVFSCAYCLITSDKVFPKDDWPGSINKYHLDFRKLESNDLKTVKLEDIADRSKASVHQTSGLVVIPIKPSKKWETDSVFTYRPFKVANKGAKPDDDLHCYFVDEIEVPFAVKRLKLNQVSGHYQLDEEPHDTYKTYKEVTRRGDRHPYGAVILKCSNGEFKAAGALTFTDDESRNISPVFFPLPQGKYR